MEPKPSAFRMKLLGLFVVVGGVLLMLGVAGMLWFDRALREEADAVLVPQRKAATDNIGFFCEQQALLGKDPWFHEPRPEGDAGPILNAWLSRGSSPASVRGTPLSLPATVSQRLLESPDWLTLKADLSALDFGWMESLRAYDRWDALKNTPAPLQEPIDLLSGPTSDFGRLLLWGRLRLLHGVRTGQPLAAARDVRHLAWILYRTDQLMGAMAAVRLLDAEREAHASMQTPPPEWRPMSREQGERMRAIVVSSRAFSSMATPVETAKQSRRCGEPVARCIAMVDAALLARFVKPLVRKAHRDAYMALEEDIAAFPCPTSLAKTLWERGVTFDDPGASEILTSNEWARRLPRAHFGPLIADGLLAEVSPTFYSLLTFRKELARGKFERKR